MQRGGVSGAYSGEAEAKESALVEEDMGEGERKEHGKAEGKEGSLFRVKMRA